MNDEKFVGFEELDNLENIDNTQTIGNQTVDSTQNNNIELPPTPLNQINVHINDQNTPIVLLFGAQESGKTMTLVRLSNYLRTLGYIIETDDNFCTSAWEYPVNCSKLNEMIGTNQRLKGTDHNDFLFIKISDNKGNPVCQILEAAGEDYFPKSKSDPRSPFPSYMQSVFNTSNKKVWLFITEPNWKVESGVKQNYVERIRFCRNQSVGRNDKFIILYNKIDKTSFISNGRINSGAAETNCGNEYPGIFNIFTEGGILVKTKKYKFVPFSTGSYDEYGAYTRSKDEFPKNLWKAIQESIKPIIW